MKTIIIENQKLNYHESGIGKTIVLLHGWGQNIEMMMPLHAHLEKYFHVITMDFPGFGLSESPKTPWGVEDYAKQLKQFMDVLKIDSPILMGHSFGGRVAIVYGAKYPTHKIVLMDAAGIQPKRGFTYYFKVYNYKLSKQILKLPFFNHYQPYLMNKAGSSDYRQLSDEMKKTFIKVVNQDLTPFLDKIHCPTLIVWGELDDATPLWMGQELERKIKDSGLIVYQGAGHYAYLEHIESLKNSLDIFFKEDMDNV